MTESYLNNVKRSSPHGRVHNQCGGIITIRFNVPHKYECMLCGTKWDSNEDAISATMTYAKPGGRCGIEGCDRPVYAEIVTHWSHIALCEQCNAAYLLGARIGGKYTEAAHASAKGKDTEGII